jgi:hypothetical protein
MVVLLCPACRDDRVVPLTFPAVLGEIMVEMPDRPIAKCVGCGHRLSAREIEDQAEPVQTSGRTIHSDGVPGSA